MPLYVEVWNERLGAWFAAAPLTAGDPPGSLSDNRAEGRDVLLFYCLVNDSGAWIGRSPRGVDYETNVDARVVIATGEPECLAQLTPGESFELEAMSDRAWRLLRAHPELGLRPLRYRFSHRRQAVPV